MGTYVSLVGFEFEKLGIEAVRQPVLWTHECACRTRTKEPHLLTGMELVL